MELKVLEKKNEIIEAVKNNDTVIVKSEPGTGKTTQVPQFLYDDGMRVIVVEPRTLEAYQAYSYVVKQRGLDDTTNTTIGCRTKKVYKNVDNFGILYCVGGFSGINKIRKGEDISNTVLIIDEAHEWKLPQEILMGWVNTYRASGHNLKIVFMSASINPMEIESYYKKFSSVAIIEIEGVQFPVSKHKIFSKIEAVNVALTKASLGKSVLFFCSGKNEIEQTINDLQDEKQYIEDEFDVDFIPLHGSLSFEEQEKAFLKSDTPKIIVCTNIAQSGITPPIQVVIDNGYEKQMRCVNGVDTLVEVLISEEDCNQRMGRAGRIEKGEYYRIVNDDSDDDNRPTYPVPEIQRLSLDKTIMKLIDMGIDPFEMKFFHQPSEKALEDSVILLEELGALKNGKLTETGKKMSIMPLTMQFARIILEAEKLGCMDDVIKAVAIMETGSLLNDRHLRENWKNYSDYTYKCERSDLFAEIDIFDQISNDEYGKDLKTFGINKRNYLMIRNRIRNLRKILADQGYDVNTTSSNEFDLISCFFSGMHMSLINFGFGESYVEKELFSQNVKWKGTYASTLRGVSGFCIGVKQIIERRNRPEEPLRLLLFRTRISNDELITLLLQYNPGKVHEEKVFNDYNPISRIISFRTVTYYNDARIRSVNHEVDRDADGGKVYNLFKNEIIDLENEWEECKRIEQRESSNAAHTTYKLASVDGGTVIRIADDTNMDNEMTRALRNAGMM